MVESYPRYDRSSLLVAESKAIPSQRETFQQQSRDQEYCSWSISTLTLFFLTVPEIPSKYYMDFRVFSVFHATPAPTKDWHKTRVENLSKQASDSSFNHTSPWNRKWTLRWRDDQGSTITWDVIRFLARFAFSCTDNVSYKVWSNIILIFTLVSRKI